MYFRINPPVYQCLLLQLEKECLHDVFITPFSFLSLVHSFTSTVGDDSLFSLDECPFSFYFPTSDYDFIKLYT